MKKNFEMIYSVLLVLFTIYVVLDTFVIEKKYKVVEEVSTPKEVISPIAEENKEEETIISNASIYKDSNISISVRGYYEYNSTIYIAEVQLNNPKLLKTAFAKSSYGRNVVEKTSTIAKRVNAILAINGDYYGVQEKGYVLRNGTIYRDTPVKNKEDLVIYEDGAFEIINESSISIEDLLRKGAYNILSFGPSLVKNSEVSISSVDEEKRAYYGNPRTAIGIIEKGHYLFVVSDGRTDNSKGLSINELAELMKSLGCITAYNLDGGGSTTMYFNNKVINNPTTFGDRINERSISDIVYVGY